MSSTQSSILLITLLLVIGQCQDCHCAEYPPRLWTIAYQQSAESSVQGNPFPHAQVLDYQQAVPPINEPVLESESHESGHTVKFGPVEFTSGYQDKTLEEQVLKPEDQVQAPPPEVETSGLVFKQSYQEISWLFGSGDDLGITTLKAGQTISFGKLPLLSVTPEFGVHFFNGPDRVDLPGEVFSTGLKITWFQPLSKEWQVIASVTPGYYSDFYSSEDAFRMSGLGLAMYHLSEEWTLTFGAVYLARADVRILPAAGFVYKPDADHKLEMTFPKPKYSVRYVNENGTESWGYLAAEFGGGTWAVKRVDGRDDLLTIRDFRFLLGWESKDQESNVDMFEIGYVFGRQVEFDSTLGDYSPDPSFMLRWNWTF